ncbi:aspartic peptidase domain-containing protein [Rhodocollybia butyracea]|uniref:Aspartic peptidase domain-containing protein n=1 Tax=Rhodocollybia butyracea TaxID=206335 RepID=A0A9P5PUW3_9AGAR|nr:aspartic peptidase domain-containing protein [Rhodocollybia butyracea]
MKPPNSRAFSVLFAIIPVWAISLDVAGRFHSSSVTPLLHRRDTTSDSLGNGSASLVDSHDISYMCNITLGGQQFEVIIDTGSEDLWVIGDVPGSQNTSKPANITYAIGSIAGFINTATLVLDDYQVDDQAYISVNKVEQQADTPGTGLIGFGPSRGSMILHTMGSSSGDPPLDRIFKQNTTTPNILTILLSRSDNFTTPTKNNSLVPLLDDQPGQITIGELIPGYSNVTSQAKLPALVDAAQQHWMTLLDAAGVIAPNGQKLNLTSLNTNLTEGNSDRLRVMFDSGFTRPQVPIAITNAFYGQIPGASFIEESNLWEVPCNYEINVSFVFSGVDYPIHPLDLTQFASVVDGKDVCYGWYQPIASDLSRFGIDVILGMAFLRNVYLLINFGDFVDGSNTSVADPYIQLLSTTNRTAAHLDFVNARLGGTDTTGTQGPDTPINHRAWFIGIISVAGVLVAGLVGYLIYRMRTRRSNVRFEGGFVPTFGSYQPVGTRDVGAEPPYRPTGAAYSDPFPHQGRY